LIEAAQRTGHIPSSFTPTQLLTLIESISVGWITTTSLALGADGDPSQNHKAHCAAVVESVRRLLS
jgi:hypothetical protein